MWYFTSCHYIRGGVHPQQSWKKCIHRNKVAGNPCPSVGITRCMYKNVKLLEQFAFMWAYLSCSFHVCYTSVSNSKKWIPIHPESQGLLFPQLPHSPMWTSPLSLLYITWTLRTIFSTLTLILLGLEEEMPKKATAVMEKFEDSLGIGIWVTWVFGEALNCSFRREWVA